MQTRGCQEEKHPHPKAKGSWSHIVLKSKCGKELKCALVSLWILAVPFGSWIEDSGSRADTAPAEDRGLLPASASAAQNCLRSSSRGSTPSERHVHVPITPPHTRN